MVLKNSRRISTQDTGQDATDLAQDAECLPYRQRLARIDHLVRTGKTAEAILLATFPKWGIGGHEPFSRANFNPDEPRDAKGRWADEDSDTSSLRDQIQYRGHFHDFVVQDLINGLNAHGGKAIANVQVFGINGVMAIPDGASLPNGWNIPYFIEVKTGFDPPFTDNQQKVYPLICLGGHAVSTDPRIKQLGLTPGQLLPPMDIMVVYTAGPSKPMTFINYCEKIGLRGSK